MKEIQTRPSSLTLDSPASHGCVCMCRTITHRIPLITEKLTVSGLNRFSPAFSFYPGVLAGGAAHDTIPIAEAVRLLRV